MRLISTTCVSSAKCPVSKIKENAGKTLLVVHDLYPSNEALDSGSTAAMPEALDQLDELLASLASGTETE